MPPTKSMPPGRKSQNKGWNGYYKSCWKSFSKVSSQLTVENVKNVIFEPEFSWIVACALLVAEFFVCVVVVQKVKYTEIDWVAYMQEVEGVVNGTTDYQLLKGDTGPLVYPAGFVWFYMALYYLTSLGTNIRLAQYVFCVIYVATLGLVFRLLCRTRKVPPYILLIISCTSYRIHSIFVLRLFNDPIAMLFLYGALNLFVSDYWSLGSLMFSLAVSVKMNILLYSPALLITYLAILGPMQTVVQLAICAGVQVVLALPFLLTHPLNYMIGAFNLGRVFMFEWTVNWRFLPEDIFLSRWLHGSLLVAHVLLLVFCAPHWWKFLASYKKLEGAQVPIIGQLMLLPLFMCNFIGMVFARSLHYQFYVWYYHTLHYLAWTTPFSASTRLLLLGIVEMCWNTYPSTELSSCLLHCCHLCLLGGLVYNMLQASRAYGREDRKVEKKE